MLNGKMLGTQIMGQLASKGMTGSMLSSFSMALGEGIVDSFKSMNQVITTDAGFMTTGSGKGKLSGLNEKMLFGLVAPSMLSGRIAGTQMVSMTQGICSAVVQHFMLMNMVDTTHTGVALGTGIGKVTGLTPTVMTAAVISKMLSKNIAGTQLHPLVKAVSGGFCTHIMATGIVNVTIMGSPAPLILAAPIPSSGVGKGKVS